MSAVKRRKQKLGAGDRAFNICLLYTSAAVSVCGPILNVMIITLSGMSAGVLVGISGLLGAGDIKQAQDAAHTSVALYALMAAVMTLSLIHI